MMIPLTSSCKCTSVFFLLVQQNFKWTSKRGYGGGGGGRSTAPKIWSLSVSKSNDKKVIHWALSAMVKFKIRRVQSKVAGV